MTYAIHVVRIGNSSGDELPAPGDYRTGCPEGEGFMPEVSWTSDKHKGGVSGLVEPFRTTFVFGINSSGFFLSVPGIIDKQPGGGNVDDRCVRGVGRHTDSVFLFVVFF